MSTRQDSTLATIDAQTDKIQGYEQLFISRSGQQSAGETPLHRPLDGPAAIRAGITACHAQHTQAVEQADARELLEAGDACLCGVCWGEP